MPKVGEGETTYIVVLPRPKLQQVKVAAAQRGITMKAFFARAVERELAAEPVLQPAKKRRG